MAAEHHDAGLVQWQASCALARLRGADHVPTAHVDDLLDHEEAPSNEVDVLPAQAGRLASAHPCDEVQVIEGGQSVIG